MGCPQSVAVVLLRPPAFSTLFDRADSEILQGLPFQGEAFLVLRWRFGSVTGQDIL